MVFNKYGIIIGHLTEKWMHIPINQEVELYSASNSREKFGHLNWGPIFNSETVILQDGDYDYLLTIIK